MGFFKNHLLNPHADIINLVIVNDLNMVLLGISLPMVNLNYQYSRKWNMRDDLHLVVDFGHNK